MEDIGCLVTTAVRIRFIHISVSGLIIEFNFVVRYKIDVIISSVIN
jgi:hypothetical protein